MYRKVVSRWTRANPKPHRHINSPPCRRGGAGQRNCCKPETQVKTESREEIIKGNATMGHHLRESPRKGPLSIVNRTVRFIKPSSPTWQALPGFQSPIMDVIHRSHRREGLMRETSSQKFAGGWLRSWQHGGELQNAARYLQKCPEEKGDDDQRRKVAKKIKLGGCGFSPSSTDAAVGWPAQQTCSLAFFFFFLLEGVSLWAISDRSSFFILCSSRHVVQNCRQNHKRLSLVDKEAQGLFRGTSAGK